MIQIGLIDYAPVDQIIEIRDKDQIIKAKYVIDSKDIHKHDLMGDHYIEISFKLDNLESFNRTDYIVWEGTRFTLRNNYTPTQENNQNYNYTLKFEAPEMLLQDAEMFYLRQDLKEGEWSLTSNAASFIKIAVDNANRYFNTTYWQVGTIEPLTTEFITFSSTNVFEALTQIAETFKAEWYITGNTIHLVNKHQLGSEIEFENEVSVASMSQSQGDAVSGFTRIVALGSTRNIPANYRPTTPGEGVDAIYQKRLRIPISKGSVIDAKPNMSALEAVETTVIFDEVYPKRVGAMSNITTIACPEKDETGVVIGTWNAFRYKDTGLSFKESYLLPGIELRLVFQSGKLNGMDFAIKFNPDSKAETDPNSQVFEIIRSEDYGVALPNETLKPENGDQYILYGFNIDLVASQYVPAAELELYNKGVAWIAENLKDKSVYECPTVINHFAKNEMDLTIGQKVKLVKSLGGSRNYILGSKEITQAASVNTFTFKVPSLAEPIQSNTQYTLSIGETEITSGTAVASFTVLVYNLSTNSQGSANMSFPISTDRKSVTFTTGNLPNNGYRLLLYTGTSGNAANRAMKWTEVKLEKSNQPSVWSLAPEDAGVIRISRIMGFEKKLINKYDATYTVGDNSTYSRLSSIQKEIDELKYAGQVYQSAGGNGVYLIKQFDNTTPSEFNAYSATASNARYLNKQTGGTVQGDTTFQKDVKVLGKGISDTFQNETFTSGQFGSGFKMWKAENGQSYAEFDNLMVRREMIINTLTIAEIKSVGGQILVSPANMYVSRVEEITDSYRCYFDTANGTITNQFALDDQVICRKFNGSNIKYYWCRVLGIGSDYIRISKTDKDGSGIPAAGDEIIQFGNRTNTARQSAIMISAYGSDAPSFKQYAGINSYNLTGKEVTVISPSGNKFTGDFIIQNTGKNVTTTISDSINNLQIGCRNYVRNSSRIKLGLTDATSTWVYVSGIVPGQEVTLSATSVGVGTLVAYKDDGYTAGSTISFTEAGQRKSYTFTKNAKVSTILFIIRGCDFLNVQLEKGNKATDWNLAPEDIQVGIDKAQTDATNAATAASTAQTSANTANLLLADIANDNKFDPSEKQSTKKEWDAIVSEYSKNVAQATTFGVVYTAYTTAYNSLSTYITPLLSNLNVTSDIVGATFRNTFKTYYDARLDLLNAIAAKAKQLADTAQTTANGAITRVSAAESNISVLQGQIVLKVNQTDFTSLQGRVSSAESSITQQAGQITSTVEKVDKKNAAYKSYTNVATDRPTVPYSKGDLWITFDGTIKQAQNTRLTGSFIDADWIDTTKYTDDSAVNNLQIGSRNYVLNSKEIVLGSGTNTFNFRPLVLSEGLQSNTEYTFSVGKTEITSGTAVTSFTLYVYNTSTSQGGGINMSFPISTDRKSVTFKTGNLPNNGYTLLMYAGTSGSAANRSMKWTELKLEKANKATDWIEAPEDTQDRIAAAQTAANNAATAASAAQTAVNTANSLLADISNDNILDVSEKQSTKKEWDIIAGEKPVIVSQAATYGVSSTDYVTKYTALGDYLTPLLASMTVNSTIAGTTFRTNFKNYYDAKIALLKLVTDKAKVLADAAQSSADTAITNASTAQTAANAAQSTANAAKNTADTATNRLNDWASDAIISPAEKTALRQQSADIQSEFKDIQSQANKYALSTSSEWTSYNSTYTLAVAALNKYTAATPENIPVTSDYANIAAYYTQRQLILDKIASTTKLYAENLVNNIKIGCRNYVRNSSRIKLGLTDATSTWVYVSGINPGQEVTLSATSVGVGTLVAYKDDGYTAGSTMSFTEAGQRKSYTFTKNAKVSTILFIIRGCDFLNVQLEKGNKATDWNLAPEDVQAGIDKAQTDATNAQSTANLKNQTFYSDVQPTTPSGGFKVGDLWYKINTVDGCYETYRWNGSTWAIINVNVSKAKQTITDNSITNLVTKTGIDNVGVGETLWSKINQTADQISLEIGKIQIGSKNYIRSSKEITQAASTNGYNLRILSLSEPIQSNTQYTLSIGSTEIISGTAVTSFTVLVYNLSTNSQGGATMSFPVSSDRKSMTFTTGNLPNNGYTILMYTGGSGNAQNRAMKWTEVKLEKASIATDWVEAPEDTQDRITAAQTTATNAATAASTAQATATNAQTSATTANNLLSDIANDNKFDPSEKQSTKKEWDVIISEYSKNTSQALTFGISTAAYQSAYNALSAYITPLLSNLAITSDIVGTTFRSTFKTYYDARLDLLNAISVKSKQLADAAQTTANSKVTADEVKTSMQMTADGFNFYGKTFKVDSTIIANAIQTDALDVGNGNFHVGADGVMSAKGASLSGKFESNANGNRIVIDPITRNLMMLDSTNKICGFWQFYNNGSYLSVKDGNNEININGNSVSMQSNLGTGFILNLMGILLNVNYLPTKSNLSVISKGQVYRDGDILKIKITD